MTRLRTKVLRVAAVTATFFASFEFCAPAVKRFMPRDGSETRLAQLWEEPRDLDSRDLFNGPWGREHAPDPKDVYTFVHSKVHGASPGMTVIDSEGRKWSIKQSAEGPVEVMHSRVLSALGYHQPPVYFLPSFTLKDDKGSHQERGCRFRLTIPELEERGDWSWQQNPFVGTRPYQGLLVILLMFGSGDLKNSNNSLYAFKRPDGTTERLYVVRDIGNALGDTGRYDSTKNDPDVFERQPFISGVTNGFVVFPYNGWHQELFRGRITPEDTAWAGDLMARLTDAQWDVAFSAGGYEPAVAARFKKALKLRIEQARRTGAAAGPSPKNRSTRAVPREHSSSALTSSPIELVCYRGALNRRLDEEGVTLAAACARRVRPARESRLGPGHHDHRINDGGTQGGGPGAGLHAAGNRRQDLHPQQGSQRKVGRARVVPESVHRWLNRRMQLAP